MANQKLLEVFLNTKRILCKSDYYIHVPKKIIHVTNLSVYGGGVKMAYKQELWDEAKKKCHLGDEEIRMAKEMGLNPKSLIKNIPNKKEMWKAPVKDWIHDMYEKRQKKAEQKARKKQQG